MADKDKDGYGWIEIVAQAGRLIGLSPVRTRWKLRAWQDRVMSKRRRMAAKAGAVTRENKICPSCGAINSVDDKICGNCGAKLRSRPVEMADRFLRHFSLGATSETVLALGFIAIYVLATLKGNDSSLFSTGSYDLIHLGGNYVPYTLAGQWWRLATCIFLHAGLIHLGFNTYALVYVMPFVRDIYGRGKAVFVFVVTGLAASAASTAWTFFRHQPGERFGVSIGASGAIMGLIGFMLVWGHRDGTNLGKNIRGNMGRWVIYTLAFGYFIGADNAAHVGGCLLGAALAYVIPTSFTPKQSPVWKVLAVICWIIIAAAAALIFYRGLALPFPPPPPPLSP